MSDSVILVFNTKIITELLPRRQAEGILVPRPQTEMELEAS